MKNAFTSPLIRRELAGFSLRSDFTFFASFSDATGFHLAPLFLRTTGEGAFFAFAEDAGGRSSSRTLAV